MAGRHFFKRHQGRGSYNLFTSYNYFLPGIKGMIMLLVMFLLGGLLGNIVILGLTFGLSAEFAQAYGTVISYPLMFVPPMIYASYQSRKTEIWGEMSGIPKGGIPLDRNDFGTLGGFKVALIVSIATLAAAFVAEPVSKMLPEMPEFLKQALEQLTEGPILVTILSVSIFAPLFEEWLCRGLVLRGLLQKLNPFSAIAVSAAFFAVMHMNPWQAIPAFLLGLLFGYVYYKTGSLKLTMLMHCVNNTFAALATRIPSLSDAETFMDVMSPWAYVCVYVACILIVCSSLILVRGINSALGEKE